MGEVIKELYREEGLGFCGRGIQKNVVAVAVPIAITIKSRMNKTLTVLVCYGPCFGRTCFGWMFP